MTEATPAKPKRGRPRKLPNTDPPPVAAAAPAGLSAAPSPPAPIMAETAAPPPVADPQRDEPRMADVRPDVRGEDPRAEAERVAAEWFGHLDSLGPHKDKYYVDPTKIPDAWSYEWRAFTVVGKENPQYQMTLQRGRWRPVPAKRHPELVPSGYDPEGAILIDGMMLMERPKVITDYQKARDHRDALAPIENIRAKLSGAPANQFPRDADPRTAPNIKTAYRAPDIVAGKA